jgi:hypothetical protein
MHATQTAAWTTDAVTPATTPATFDALSSSPRRAGRALAAEATRRDDRTAVGAATRPIVTAMRAELRQWRGRGGAGEDAAAGWSRMVDAAVQEAYRMARFQSGQTGIVAPLTVLATGS